jgi:Tol biopolymer transport system component
MPFPGKPGCEAIFRYGFEHEPAMEMSSSAARKFRSGVIRLTFWLVLVAVAIGCSSVPQQHPLPAVAYVMDFKNVYIRSSDGKTHFVAKGSGVTWMPDHKSLLVNRRGRSNSSELWRITPGGVLLDKVTSVYPGQVRFFAAAKSGTRQFVTYVTDKSGIQIVNADGSGKKSILTNIVINDLAISADGSKIGFITQNPTGRSSIIAGLYVVNSNGTGRARLVLSFTPHRDLSCLAFSPDGRWMALGLQVNKGGYSFQSGVWLVRPNGTGLHKLADGFSPIWSPDGSWIAFVNEAHQRSSLFKIHPDGTSRGLITHLPVGFDFGCTGDNQPTW